jgi:hypothetical protein
MNCEECITPRRCPEFILNELRAAFRAGWEARNQHEFEGDPDLEASVAEYVHGAERPESGA